MNKTELLVKITEMQTHAALESRKYKRGSKDAKFYSGMVRAFQNIREAMREISDNKKEWSIADRI
jgi:hypothetical protein